MPQQWLLFNIFWLCYLSFPVPYHSECVCLTFSVPFLELYSPLIFFVEIKPFLIDKFRTKTLQRLALAIGVLKAARIVAVSVICEKKHHFIRTTFVRVWRKKRWKPPCVLSVQIEPPSNSSHWHSRLYKGVIRFLFISPVHTINSINIMRQVMRQYFGNSDSLSLLKCVGLCLNSCAVFVRFFSETIRCVTFAVARGRLNGPCLENGVCVIANSVCSKGQCVCSDDTFNNEGFCGESCRINLHKLANCRFIADLFGYS